MERQHDEFLPDGRIAKSAGTTGLAFGSLPGIRTANVVPHHSERRSVPRNSSPAIVAHLNAGKPHEMDDLVSRV